MSLPVILKSGEIMYPVSVETDYFVADDADIAAPGSKEYEAFLSEATPADEDDEARAEIIRSAK